MSFNNITIGIPPYYIPKREEEEKKSTCNTPSESTQNESNQSQDKWDFEKEKWEITFLDKKA